MSNPFFTSNSTYNITTDITLESDTVIPDNVTLIFQGGKILSNTPLTLTGQRTRIVAPICQIFGEDIEVDGSWDIDRAYPQWFGYATYQTPVDYLPPATCRDAGPAINKAIKMKQMGEVFLPKGIYVIATPVYTQLGIQLIGEKGMDPNSDHPQGTTLKLRGTVLQTWKSNQTDALKDSDNVFMVYINTIPDSTNSITGSTGYKAGQITTIENMCLYNRICHSSYIGTEQQVQQQTTACIGGIWCSETATINNVRFYNLRRAVVFGHSYYDVKCITNCDYVCSGKTESSPSASGESINIYSFLDMGVYAFDLGFLGDAAQFSHNAIHNGTFNKGIRLSYCGGGHIGCNVINADVLIENSKAVTFENNHVEGGHTIIIKQSVAELRNNYIEKRYNPSILVFSSVPSNASNVLLEYNSFLYYENLRDTALIGNENAYYSNICKWDVAIDKFTILDVHNTFRLRVIQDRFEDNSFFGIQIAKATIIDDNTFSYSNFNEFNNFSYALSRSSQISIGFQVKKSFSVEIAGASVPRIFMESNDTVWYGQTGYYWYACHIIWDSRRHITRIGGDPSLNALFWFTFYSEDPATSNELTSGGPGAVLLFDEKLNDVIPDNGQQFLLRVFRYKSNTSSRPVSPEKSVTLPLCGALALYDNGISLSGYQWNPFTGDFLTQCIQPNSIAYLGNNVRCLSPMRVTNYTTLLGWEQGDVVINTGNDTSWDVDVIK